MIQQALSYLDPLTNLIQQEFRSKLNEKPNNVM